MEEIKKSIADIGKAVHELHAENDKLQKELKEKGSVDALLTEKVDKINKDITEISALKRQLEALETLVARKEFEGGGTTALDKVKAEHKAAFEKWFRKGGDAELSAVKELQVQAGLSTLSDPDGGYLVAPAEFDAAVDRVAGTISVMRQLATVRAISTKEFTKLVNVGGTTSGWT